MLYLSMLRISDLPSSRAIDCEIQVLSGLDDFGLGPATEHVHRAQRVERVLSISCVWRHGADNGQLGCWTDEGLSKDLRQRRPTHRGKPELRLRHWRFTTEDRCLPETNAILQRKKRAVYLS